MPFLCRDDVWDNPTAVIAGLIVMAFMNKGKSAAMVGSFGVFDMILACIGIVTGVKAVSYTQLLV